MSTIEKEKQESPVGNLLKKFELMQGNAENLTPEDIKENIEEFKDCLLEIEKKTKEHFFELVQGLIEQEEFSDEIRKIVAETEKQLEKSENLLEELEKENRELQQQLEFYRTLN